MEKGRPLPAFTVGGFMDSVSRGLEEKKRLEEEARRETIRIEMQHRKKRDEETAFWTTPELRPLAEPPVLDWEHFFRVYIPSDLRYKALFPNDPEMRCKAKDFDGESRVLIEYGNCVRIMRDVPETDHKRREFYQNLCQDLFEEWQAVYTEHSEIWSMATSISRFEFRKLDNDGLTTKLEEWIEKGADIFHGQGDEVREKYQHLIPSDFVGNCLATFEFFWLDWDGDTTDIKTTVGNGKDILAAWPQEVQDKYGHLCPPLAIQDPSLHTQQFKSVWERDSRRRTYVRRAARFPARTRVGYEPRGIERGLRVFRHRCQSTSIV